MVLPAAEEDGRRHLEEVVCMYYRADCNAAVGSAYACAGYKLELVLTEGLPNDLALVMCRIIREFFLDLLEGV